jgi:hypothetical protein
MNDLDRKIQAALRRENVDESSGGEPNIAEEILAAFRGRRRWVSATAMAVQLAAFIGVVGAAVEFCLATDLSSQLRWGGLASALFVVVSMIKIWFWLELQNHRVLREVKRLELLLVSRPPA